MPAHCTTGAKGGGFPPSGNTGGQSTRGEEKKTGEGAVFHDWLNVTVEETSLLHQLFEESWRCFLSGGWQIEHAPGRGKNGFTDAADIRLPGPGGRSIQLAKLAWGGASQAGRFWISLNGEGCRRVSDWRALHDWLLPRSPKITRVDLSVDDYVGAFPVDAGLSWWRAGEFRSGRGNPQIQQDGDWLGDQTHGRTLYVGLPGSARRMCIYEKGLQLRPGSGDPWVRWELRLKGDELAIPLRVLLDPSPYYVGAYPCLARIVEVAGERMQGLRSEGRKLLDAALRDLRAQYGGVIRALREYLQDDAGLLDLVQGTGVPEKYAKAVTLLPREMWALKAMLGLPPPPSVPAGQTLGASDEADG